MKHMYTPIGIQNRLLRSHVNYGQMGEIVRIFQGGSVNIHATYKALHWVQVRKYVGL